MHAPCPPPNNCNHLIKCIRLEHIVAYSIPYLGITEISTIITFQIYKTLDNVADRSSFFAAQFCCQITWAIIKEGWAYFSQWLGDTTDIEFYMGNRLEIEWSLCNQTLNIHSTFPCSGYQGCKTRYNLQHLNKAVAFPLQSQLLHLVWSKPTKNRQIHLGNEHSFSHPNNDGPIPQQIW